jgi:type II secretory pathway pseudopilin PulG
MEGAVPITLLPGGSSMQRRNSGYSLIEVMMVAALTTIASGVAVVQYRSSKTILDANVAASTVISQLRYAREIAVDQRRNVEVEFVGSNGIEVRRIESDGTETVVSAATLPSGYAFGLPAGTADTPDGYGDDAPVYFNGATSGTFLGDGIFVGPGAIVISGSVFTIGPGGNGSARAVTLAGASGRIKQYYIRDGAWAERN